jgi:hypothetical protein
MLREESGLRGLRLRAWLVIACEVAHNLVLEGQAAVAVYSWGWLRILRCPSAGSWLGLLLALCTSWLSSQTRPRRLTVGGHILIGALHIRLRTLLAARSAHKKSALSETSEYVGKKKSGSEVKVLDS